MADNSVSLAKWREYFRTANSDIFTVVEHAILIAASDYPYDFKQNRDRIAELLFTCKVTKCFGCDKIELTVPNADGLDNTEEKINSEIDFAGSKDSKESKANSSSRDNEDDLREVMGTDVNPVSNYSYEDAEALTDEIEEESKTLEEVLRIKETFDGDRVPESLLLNCLRRLRVMNLSVETLKATDIGKSVNAMRKHRSKEIQNLVRTLIDDWKVAVDTFLSAAAAFREMATESAKASPIEDEEGLPSPPLDEGIFFTTPTSMELSQFFDGIDDDGNPKASENLNRNRESVRRPTLDKVDTRSVKPSDSRTPPKDKKVEPKRNPETMLMKAPVKPIRPCTDESEPGRPRALNTGSAPVRSKPTVKPKVNNGMTIQQTSENRPIQKKPMPPQHEANNMDEASIGLKLEAAKRKLHERYQEAENAKKQRTIQVVELHDLPKNGHGNRNQHMRPGNHNRPARR